VNTSVPVGTPDNDDAGTALSMVQNALSVEPRLVGVHVAVDTRENVAQLEGYVATRNDYDLADRVVRAVPGIRRVCNMLQIGVARLLWAPR
jgi:osmotically-inducible protein OsmY